MGSAEELRALFEKRLAEGLPDGGFHPQDLERVKDDFYLTRIIERSKNDMVEASKSLWTILKWRKSVGASDITEDNIRMDYINKGVLFPHCRDTDGCKMIILKCKEYVKGQFEFEEVKKIFIYWLDRLEREERGNKVTLFLDLDGASLNNFDIDLIKYMINLFYYYPKFLNQIVIYQLPWILTAAFKPIFSRRGKLYCVLWAVLLRKGKVLVDMLAYCGIAGFINILWEYLKVICRFPNVFSYH